jgi:hypothetical protein
MNEKDCSQRAKKEPKKEPKEKMRKKLRVMWKNGGS